MKRILLASVAAVALLTAVDTASAQGVPGSGKSEAPNAAAPSAAPSSNAAPSKAEAPAGKGQAPAPKGAVTQAPSAAPVGHAAEEKMEPKGASSMPGKADAKASSDKKDAESKTEMKASEQKPAGAGTAAERTESRPGSTAAKAPSSARHTASLAAPPSEKRSQIVSTIKEAKIQETTNVTFNISVGTRVPENVRYYPLPRHIVEIYPAWDGYEVIYVHGQYLIIDPDTREIVYVIES